MFKTLAHLFTPRPSNNFKAKSLHASSLSIFMIIIMASQITFSLIGKSIPGVLGLTSTITTEELINLTNQERQKNGLQELKLNPVLVNAATKKAADMINKNYWAHTSPEGKTPWSFFKEVEYQYLYAGENLARDFQDSDSVIKAWMNSPTHRDNILSSRYRDIGIVVIHDTFQGQETTLVVQMFGTTADTVLPQAGNINQIAEAVLAEVTTTPVLSSFDLTKSMSISLTLILLLVIALDSLIIAKKKIIRLSGRGLAHLLFLGILLLLLIVIQPGLVL
ncbi:MAG: CAP domain-containing protein [Candidatus Beckwithbacteria bacterium]|nr:CAP domain-containing protein [Patescibacteria group bacterium]